MSIPFPEPTQPAADRTEVLVRYLDYYRAVLLSSGDEIGADAFDFAGVGNLGSTAAAGSMVGRTVADVERDLIIDTLKHTLGNRTHAAKILGISIRTLRNKVNAYVQEGMAVPAPGASETA